MEIVEARIEDAVELARLHVAAERQAYAARIPALLERVSNLDGRIEIWRLALARHSPGSNVLIAKTASGSPVGFLSGRLPSNQVYASLYGIYVLRESQRAGVGKRLFTKFVRQLHAQGAETLSCVVPEVNIQAREFFAWTGGMEVRSSSEQDEQSHVEMMEFRWSNVERLLSYLNFLG